MPVHASNRSRGRVLEAILRMARVDLRRVAKARRQLENAVKERDDAIRAAVASGETYRDVARMAGVSYQRVAQIVARD